MENLRIQVFSRIDSLYDDWHDLWTTCGGGPFTHPAWHQAYSESKGDPGKVMIVGAFQGSRLAGVLPLQREEGGVLRYLSCPRSDYEDSLTCLDLRETVNDAFARFLSGERYDLGEMPEGSSLASALIRSGARSRPAAPCPGIRLSEGAAETIHRKSSIRRHAKKLAKHGRIQLTEPSPEEVPEMIDALINQHVSRWLASGSPSLFLESNNIDFYHRLVSHPHFHEFGKLHLLRAGDHLVACHVGFFDQERFYWYKPTFDLSFRKEGPGEVLLAELLKETERSGLEYFDFTRGSEAFKQRFSNVSTQNTRLFHRLPFLLRARRSLQSRSRRWKSNLGNWKRSTFPPRPEPEIFFRLEQGVHPPESSPEFTYSFGPIDLVHFGALAREIPRYLSPSRFPTIVERKERGDRSLVIRHTDTGETVHVSWMRRDSDEIVGDNSVFSLPSKGTVAVIFDCWTSPDYRGRELYPRAIRYLASKAAEEDLPAWIYCREGNKPSRRGILKAGFLESFQVAPSHHAEKL